MRRRRGNRGDLECVCIGGMYFTPAVEDVGRTIQGAVKLAQRTKNGRLLWCIPGGGMATEDELPEIARMLAKSTGKALIS